MKKEIVVKVQVEGIHHWPECPIEEVEFLRWRHRHMFSITLWKEVHHNDREIEIIQLGRRVKEYLGTQPIDFGRRSCEDIAEDLLGVFGASAVEVLEDNENGAKVYDRI